MKNTVRTQESSVRESTELSFGELIEEYKQNIDRGLLRANLKRSVEERLLNLQKFLESIEELRKAVKATHK